MAITPVKWSIVQQEHYKLDKEATEVEQEMEQHLPEEARTRVYEFVGMVDALSVYAPPSKKVRIDPKTGQPMVNRPSKMMTTVKIGNGKGGELILRKLNRKSNLTPFAVVHPPKMEHKTIKCGLGKNAQYTPDVLNPMMEIKGEVERYNESEFKSRVERFLQNPELMTTILSLLNGDKE